MVLIGKYRIEVSMFSAVCIVWYGAVSSNLKPVIVCCLFVYFVVLDGFQSSHIIYFKMCFTTFEVFISATDGKHFLFAIPRIIVEKGIGMMFIAISSSHLNRGTQVKISAPCINFIMNYTVYEYEHIQMPLYPLTQQSEGIDHKGIEIVSDEDISVSVYFYKSIYEDGGFLAFPVQALSTRYIVATYEPTLSYKNYILLVGVVNNTEVMYKTDASSNITLRTNLHKFDTFLVRSSKDISGAVVTSNKPVAVFSGSEFSKIPVGEGEDNYLVGQMIPTYFWTNKYIIPPIYPHRFYIVRIFSDHDNTIVNYYNRTHNDTEYMSQGKMVEIMFGAEPAIIESNNYISVVQYFVDNENMNGNPYMVVSQGLTQYSNQYKISCDPRFQKCSLAITILQSVEDELQLNGHKLENWDVVSVPVPYPFNDYVTLFYNMSTIPGRLEHKRGIKFGVVQYSLISTAYGYGSALKLVLSNNNSVECTTSTSLGIAETTVPGLSFSQQQSSTEGPRNSTIHTLYNQENKTWCFKCDGMTHLQYCDMVTECKNNEVCFVERYSKSISLQLYRSGCMGKSMCQSVGVNAECQQCCNGNFCNIEGCGDEGVPAIGSRGPFCFACDHHGENDVCRTVQMCAPGQLCKTEMYVWGSGHHFIKGCADQQICRLKKDLPAAERRSIPSCLSCCHEDFCNLNCTVGHAVSLVG